MPKLSVNLGILLIILGIFSYYISGAASITALIPAFFGVVFSALGFLAAKKDAFRKHAMHAALLLAILGLGGSFGGLTSTIAYIGGGESPERFMAAVSQAIMATLCILFLILGVKSFIDARKVKE